MGNLCVCLTPQTLARIELEAMKMPSYVEPDIALLRKAGLAPPPAAGNGSVAATKETDAMIDRRTALDVAESWSHLVTGQTLPFQAAHAETPSLTPLVFFYNLFYYNLFELAPETKPLFTRSIQSQGKMLANVIKNVVIHAKEKDDSGFKTSLELIARHHNALGVSAEHYSLVGIVLVHTVRTSLGPEFFTPAVAIGWSRLYSRMMKVIIPVAVRQVMPRRGDEDAKLFYKADVAQAMADGTPIQVPRQVRPGDSSPDTSNNKSDTKKGFASPTAAAAATASAGEHKTKERARDVCTFGKSIRQGPFNFCNFEHLAKIETSMLETMKGELLTSLPSLVKNVTYKGENHTHVIIGCELIDWLIENQYAETRTFAARVAGQLHVVGMRHIAGANYFTDDYSFYTFELPADAPAAAVLDELSTLRRTLLTATITVPPTFVDSSHHDSRAVMAPQVQPLIRTRMFKLAEHANSLVASELVDWLLATNRITERTHGVAIGRQLMLHAGLRVSTPTMGHHGAAVSPRHHHASSSMFSDEYLLYTFDAPPETVTQLPVRPRAATTGAVGAFVGLVLPNQPSRTPSDGHGAAAPGKQMVTKSSMTHTSAVAMAAMDPDSLIASEPVAMARMRSVENNNSVTHGPDTEAVPLHARDQRVAIPNGANLSQHDVADQPYTHHLKPAANQLHTHHHHNYHDPPSMISISTGGAVNDDSHHIVGAAATTTTATTTSEYAAPEPVAASPLPGQVVVARKSDATAAATAASMSIYAAASPVSTTSTALNSPALYGGGNNQQRAVASSNNNIASPTITTGVLSIHH